jgi:hypothetical protein
MRLSERTIQGLGKLVTGDEKLTPYRSGPKLVTFFNDLGSNDHYPEGGGFPSRWKFVEDKLRELNGSDAIRAAIARTLDPAAFLDFEKPVSEAVAYLNKYLKFDDYEVVIAEKHVKIRNLKGPTVELEHPYKESTELTHLFIDEQIQKCERKIGEADFDGAITNARSLLEAVLVSLERELSASPEEYDGDLVRFYRRVQKLLNLDPSRKDVSESLKQVLSGLISIVNGLASLRNKMGDAHVTTSRASRHHAKLAVNAAKTLADFLFETKTFQAKRREKNAS